MSRSLRFTIKATASFLLMPERELRFTLASSSENGVLEAVRCTGNSPSTERLAPRSFSPFPRTEAARLLKQASLAVSKIQSVLSITDLGTVRKFELSADEKRGGCRGCPVVLARLLLDDPCRL